MSSNDYVTDQFGNKGFFLENVSGKKCSPLENGQYPSNCYFSVDVRSGGPTTDQFGNKIGGGRPSEFAPIQDRSLMDTVVCGNASDLDTCSDNYNCQINDVTNRVIKDGQPQENAREYLNNNRKALNTGYWNNKWSKDEDVCDWEGVECVSYGENDKYISNVDISQDYFKPLPNMCSDSINGVFTQEDWENKQRQACSNLDEDKCNDNEFCLYGSSGSNSCGSVSRLEARGECSQGEVTQSCQLDPKYIREHKKNKNEKIFEDFRKHGNGFVSDVGLVNNVSVPKSSSKDYFSDDSLQIASGLTRTIQRDNQEIGVKGIVERSALSDYYFSDENIKVVQDTIRYKVFKDTQDKYIIDYQSPQELFIVMRSILLQHANFKVGADKLLDEIRALNKMVVDWCAPEIVQNVKLYGDDGGYIDRLTNLPEPIDFPAYTDKPSNRTYDLSQFVGI